MCISTLCWAVGDDNGVTWLEIRHAACCNAQRSGGTWLLVTLCVSFSSSIRVMFIQFRVGIGPVWARFCSCTLLCYHVSVVVASRSMLGAGLRSAIANQPIKRAAAGGKRERAKKPRQQRFKIEKATNAHLPFLFSGAQPKNIDA